MLFNSPQFAVFFPLVTALFFLLPHRFRWGLLVAASCAFYMAFVPKYILILALLIAVDYLAGLGIEQARSAGRRKAILLASLAANLGVLGFFKYFNFVNENMAQLAHFLDWNYPVGNLSILLPIGLSFHTFQSMSYTIEVYYGNQKAERHLGIYALYVLFYPQLVAGPIERPQNLLHQFHEPKRFDADRVRQGLLLMLGGFLKKVVVADRLAVVVNQVYGHPTAYQGWPLIIATYFFGFQVYADFSGYSDIARGAAQVMGFELVENFRRPYAARNIGEFWRSWHMSLLSWFRSYVYMPIAFSGDRSEGRVYLAILAVFLASGIWHGAAWTFVCWGLYHGLYSALSVATARRRAALARRLGLARIPRLHALWQTLVTFHLVTFSYIFFRAPSLRDSWYLFRNMFSGLRLLPIEQYRLGTDARGLALMLALIAAMEGLQLLHSRRPLRPLLAAQPRPVRWALYYAAIVGLFYLGEVRPQSFIYFQF